MARILIVDNEASILSVLSTLLKAEGYEVVASRSGQKALDLLAEESFDMTITDIRMSPVDGMEVLRYSREHHPSMAVIMLTAYGSVETAIESMRVGAFDYVTKPFKVDELLITIQRALKFSTTIRENQELKQELGKKFGFESIVSESEAMQRVCETVRCVAPTDTTVLIYGESGTGKEVIAKAVHANSTRANKTFTAINCAALPEALLESEMFGHVKGAFTGAATDKVGLFEASEGGTIFLDEISSMPLNIQGKLLRVLQERELRRVGSNETIPVDARVIAATNLRLEDAIREGTFREDLYYRLSVIPIEIKPLRERTKDIIPLVNFIMERDTPEGMAPPELSPEVREVLERYKWPGNVRELENAVKHALTFAKDDYLSIDLLPPKLLNSVNLVDLPISAIPGEDDFHCKALKDFLRDKEVEYIRQVLGRMEGDKEKAADALRISLATLYRKLPSEKPDGLAPE